MQSSLKISLPSGPSFEVVFVEGGEFLMGDDESEYDSEKPAHQVKVSSFYMGKYQVTQELWESVMGNNPSRFKGEKRPVENVSWYDAKDFIEKLNEKTGKNFRLPSEAEWEYAGRGGKYSQGFTYTGSDKLSQVGWYYGNSNNETHEVGLLLSNELGLYDMSGNVFEWCEDDDHDNYEGALEDGSAWIDSPNRGFDRVLCGGSCFRSAVYCRPSNRYRYTPDSRTYEVGFRLVLPLQFTP